MSGFFKKFGKGLLYLLVLPIFIIVLAGYAIYGFVIFFFVFIRSLIDFFRGRNFFRDLPEDIEAKKRLAKVGNVFTNQEKKETETIVVMEAGDVAPQTTEIENSTPLTIEQKEEEHFIEDDDYLAIEEKEEIDETEEILEEEEILPKEIIVDEEEEEKILPEDDEDDDHFF